VADVETLEFAALLVGSVFDGLTVHPLVSNVCSGVSSVPGRQDLRRLAGTASPDRSSSLGQCVVAACSDHPS
jgi:hypothetical protein